MILKANLHLHTADGKKERREHIRYNIYEAIDCAQELGFKVLAITCHQKAAFKKEMDLYAQKQGILLIPGIEAKIERRHTVILNCLEDVEKIKTFNELRYYKKEHPEIFILAPHPFFPLGHSLKNKLEKNIDIFDAIEHSWYWAKKINYNKRAKEIAQKYNKPYMGTSDTHFLNYLNTTFCLIESEDITIENILKSLKNKNFENKSLPLTFWQMFKVGCQLFINHFKW